MYKKHIHKAKHHIKKYSHILKMHWKKVLLLLVAVFFVVSGALLIWVSTFQIPDLNSFENRIVAQSTKIYDRTGKILLYDVHEEMKRTQIPFENISRNVKNATVAIEDAEFYQHHGIKIKSIFRAIFANLISGGYGQGGSTITQQVIKNSLLTTEKKISRKLKEWVLSLKIEKIMSKEQILSIYLNETPYGGNLYGVEEAAQRFFNKSAADVTLAESAYLAAIPQAPTFYSPYGQNLDKLKIRQKLVLSKMLENNFISKDEYDSAIKEEVTFIPREQYGIKAPHFVEFIKQYLVQKYGENAIQENGYKVITTLDYDLQAKAEEIIKKRALENKEKFNAENAAGVAIDPKTGQILVMVGSRDYFDKEIDGNYNIALALRQPGSTFKPFVYATAFNKGYLPETVLFDAQTEFQSSCTPDGKPMNPSTEITPENSCYMPDNYDNIFKGPMTLRSALAESRNTIAIKTLYLAGIKDSLETARSMGITSLNNPDRYGLTLVLGGGEVSLLEEVSAYGVFANNGTRLPYTGIISVEDQKGNVLEKYEPKPRFGLNEDSALKINSILSDDDAKVPAYGYHSVMYYPGRTVASKTGTTNDYKDAWIIGYTPSIVYGMWAGNNNNTPMEKKVAGLIVAPMWHEVMNEILKTVPDESFKQPQEQTATELKPIIRGVWQGDDTYLVDKISGKLATEFTPTETQEERAIPNVHSILYWVDKKDPLGPAPENPGNDYQFNNWEYGVQKWLKENPIYFPTKPTTYDDVHTENNLPKIQIVSPNTTTSYTRDQKINLIPAIQSTYPISKVDYYINNQFIGSSSNKPYLVDFVPANMDFISSDNELKIVATDKVYNKTEKKINLKIN